MEKLFTRKEAADLLGISVSTLDAVRMAGDIAFVQYSENGRVYFTEAGLAEYITRSTHRARHKETYTGTTFRKKRKPFSG